MAGFRCRKICVSTVKTAKFFATRHGSVFGKVVFCERRLHISGNRPSGNAIPREELTSRLDVHITDHWRFGTRFQQDLELQDRIRDEVHLTYQDDCTYVQVAVRPRPSPGRHHRKPETQVRLVFALRTLGGNAPGAGW